MDECFKCGISGEKTRLFDAISNEGIVKVCRNCFSEENLPLIKRPTSFQIKDSERQQTYQERIREFDRIPRTRRSSYREDVSLRDIVDRNLKINFEGKARPRPDLVENFHWVIMRARRARHISRERFAKDLGESETLIKMIEQGVLPEDDNRIINKIEAYLKISLRKPGFVQEKPKQKGLSFDSVSVRNLTISDLKEMKEKREEDIFSKSAELWDGDIGEDSEKEKDEELSQEDIDDLIFGRTG